MYVLLIVKIILMLYNFQPVTFVLGFMKLFYHRVLSYLLGPVSLCSSCLMGVCSNDFEPNLFVACFLPFVVCTTGVFLGHCA